MIHRFVGNAPGVTHERWVPVVGSTGAVQALFAIPPGGSTPSYVDLTSTHLSLTGAYWSKPCVTPDGRKFVCDHVTNSGTQNFVDVIDVGADTATSIASEPNGAGGSAGVNAPMYPDVHPNGVHVIYRRHQAGVSPFERAIHRVDIDGTNGTQLFLHPNPMGGTINVPLYSYDGSKIAFCVDHSGGTPDDICVIDEDGSNFQIIATRATYFTNGRYGYSWANNSNTLAFVDGADIRTINADGTGDTVIYTDPDPRFGVVGPTKWWSPDDTRIAYMQYETSDPDPKGTLGTIDVGGGGFTAFSPSFKIFGGSRRFQPQVFGGRVWCQPYDPSSSPARDYILSVRFDGSGTREEAFWLHADSELYMGFIYEPSL